MACNKRITVRDKEMIRGIFLFVLLLRLTCLVGLKKDVEHLKQELYDCGTYKPANGASAREESRRDTQ